MVVVVAGSGAASYAGGGVEGGDEAFPPSEDIFTSCIDPDSGFGSDSDVKVGISTCLNPAEGFRACGGGVGVDFIAFPLPPSLPTPPPIILFDSGPGDEVVLGGGTTGGVGVGRALSKLGDFPDKSPFRRWFALELTLCSVLLLVGVGKFGRGILFSETTVTSIPLGVPTFLRAASFACRYLASASSLFFQRRKEQKKVNQQVPRDRSPRFCDIPRFRLLMGELNFAILL